MFVYKQYEQHVLDAQYNTRLQVPVYADYLNRWELLSRKTEQKLPVIKDLAYGEAQRERLDIYPSAQPHSKTLVFIHGGYWQMLDKSMFQFVADGFHAYEVTTVLLSYPLAPVVTIDEIVLSCRKAIEWLYNNLSAYNGDPNQIYIAGHSAGGHLAAMLMATNWESFGAGISANLPKGICVLSGLFNLVPLQLSYINNVIKMDRETAVSNSPVTLEPLNICPVIVAVGAEESEEFNAQSKELYACWKNNGVDIQLLLLPGQNHYSIAETMVDPQSSLHEAMRRMMKIE